MNLNIYGRFPTKYVDKASVITQHTPNVNTLYVHAFIKCIHIWLFSILKTASLPPYFGPLSTQEFCISTRGTMLDESLSSHGALEVGYFIF